MEENGNGTLDGGRREESTYFLHFNFQSVNVWGKCSHYTSKEKEAGNEQYITEEYDLKKKCYTVTHTYTHNAHILASQVYVYEMSHT